MLIAAIVVLVIGIAALYWVILKNASEKILIQFKILSERLGLELHCPPPSLGGFVRAEPSLFGHIAGREVSISVPGKGLQNARQIETVLKLELKGRGFEAQIAQAGLLGGIRQRDSGGKPRWKSGNAEFDAAVDVRTRAADQFDHLLGADRRNWLITNLKQGKGTFYLGQSGLAYAELGLVANETRRERMEEVLTFLLDLAETIEGS
jgi:hypothetical protein